MENKLKNLFNKNLLLRLLSLIIFIPLMLLPIVVSNYLLFMIYILFNAVILNEVKLMKVDHEKKKLLFIYTFLLLCCCILNCFLCTFHKINILKTYIYHPNPIRKNGNHCCCIIS